MNERDVEAMEVGVCQALTEILSCYKTLNDLAGAMLEKQAKQESIEGELQIVADARLQIEKIEQDSQAQRQAYREQNESPSAAVNDLTRDTTRWIEKLMVKFDRLEKHTRDSFDKLVPRIDQSVRQNQMRQAYGGSSSGN